jgi:anti-sigma factor RsiW
MTTAYPPPCREMLQDISAYLDGDLAPAACAAIERHAQECPACRAALEGLRQTVGLCRQAADLPMPDAVRIRARDAVRELLAQQPAGT